MSLATRCTACGTVFRVVQDQLKVSEGWVRCGRCKEVFNALEGLFDLDREAPPQWQAAGAQDAAPPETQEPAAPPPSAHGGLHAASADALAEPEPASALAFAADVAAESSAFAASQADSESRDSQGFADARFNIELALEDERLAAEAQQEGGFAIEAPAAEEATAAEPAPEPGFLQQAANEERWRRPGIRLALGAAAFALALALAAQAALHWRNLVAAQWPATRPPLALACEALGCRIEPPRRIEDIAVESSTLTRAAPGSSALRLAVGLRNRGTLALALPHLELSLTDANGELIARRALAAAEFRGAGATLAPATETTLQTLLADPGGRVAGYTIEVFYP